MQFPSSGLCQWVAPTMDFGAARGVVCTTFALVGHSLTLGPDGDGNVGGESSTVRSVTQQWTPTSGVRPG